MEPRQNPSILGTLRLIIEPKAIRQITRPLMIANSVTMAISLAGLTDRVESYYFDATFFSNESDRM